MNFIKKIKRNRRRAKFEKAIDSSVEMMRSEVKMFVSIINTMEENNGVNEYAKLMATSLQFVLLSSVDILILTKYLINPTINQIDKNLFARTLAIHYYEFFQDVGKIFGKEIQEQLTVIKSLVADKQFLITKTLFKVIRREYVEIVKPIRMKVSAHKDRDVSNQYRLIESVNVEQMEKLGAQFLLLTLAFMQFKNTFQKDFIAFRKKRKFS